ncbi:phosphotransferase family protein [Nocardioides mangrovi]|uniref:Phosphotransferase family protein n=1 Tax=Nocardioides mangrovi TaxID=2874580 RepID=A0ABS7UC09_9ACTN|nr:phosphotransferase family protein [Nocardioides mangrovi]MBZ5738380.1 phosphotransferase family protein [Nocardioides mangrovi]
MPVQELSDVDVVDRATEVARRTWPGAVVSEVRRLEGGVSSLTYAARVSADELDQQVVLKLAPPGLEPVRNRDVLRQARVLDALAPVPGFPVPRVLLRDAGAPPEVPPMFAMELRPGQAYEPLLDVADLPPSAAEVATREHELTRALALLQSRTPASLGVGDEPVSTAGEELARWQRLFATVDADIAPGHESLGERLAARVPADIEPRLVHGDYRAANMLFVGPRLEAVIDWEIWSVGDPRPDLAWVLLHTAPSHVFHPDRSAADLEAGRLMPTAADLLATYVAARRELGASVAELADATTDLDWFLGVAHYKVASTIAVIWKRERKRPEPDPKVAHAAAHLDEVLAAGHAALG